MPRTLGSARQHILIAAAVIALAVGVCAAIDAWLSARVSAGTDTAQQLAPLYPYIGVDRTYVLARALGVTALLTSALAVAVGLTVAGRRQTLSGTSWLRPVHRTLSLLTIALAAAHATVPYAGVFPPFGGWATATVPFAQPYSWGTTAEWAESAGIIAWYVMVLLGPSYYVARRWRRGWGMAHRLALATYLLAVTHTLLLGSDFLVSGGLRTALIGAQIPLLALLGWRVRHRRMAAAGTWALAAAAGALTVAGILGMGLGGFPLHGAAG